MAKGQQHSNKEIRKPKKSAAAKPQQSGMNPAAVSLSPKSEKPGGKR